jgi:flavin-dependent dehydrogenase
LRKITVIGGGLAGLIASIRLSRAGHQITLVEKQEFPRHKVCGEYISMEVHDFLCREGLLPSEKKLPFINKLSLTSASGGSTDLTLKSGGFGISRYYYENFLYTKAIENAVNVLHDEVTNIQKGEEFIVETKKAKNITSDIVIAAYGKRTKLDKHLNRRFFSRHSPYVGVKFHAKYLQHDPKAIVLHNFSGGYCGICNVEDGITNFCYLVHRDKLRVAGSIERLEEVILYENPLLKEALANAERTFKKPLVINEICFDTKAPVEDSVLMIGDAAGMITPLCGNGMAMAIHTAKLLTDIIIENPKLSVGNIAIKYKEEWNKIFSTRLAWGRFIQKHFFGKNWSSGLAVAVGNKMPAVAGYLIQKTHGDKI